MENAERTNLHIRIFIRIEGLLWPETIYSIDLVRTDSRKMTGMYRKWQERTGCKREKFVDDSSQFFSLEYFKKFGSGLVKLERLFPERLSAA